MIQHDFSKSSLINLILKDWRSPCILFISLTIGSLFKLMIMTHDVCVNSELLATSLKIATSL